MIDFEKAMDIAQKQFPDYPVFDAADIGERWAFSFDTGEPAIPGIPYVCVNKSIAAVDYLPVPPIENLDIIKKGKKVKAAPHNSARAICEQILLPNEAHCRSNTLCIATKCGIKIPAMRRRRYCAVLP